MRVWEGSNGYMGASDVRCVVLADSQEEAIELACQCFKEDEIQRAARWGLPPDERFYQRVYVEDLGEAVKGFKHFLGD